MATTTRPWTRAELARLPDDGNRYEVLDGVLLVTPQPSARHQRTAFRLAHVVGAYLERYGIGFVVGPGAIPKGESELQPDFLAILDATIPLDADWADLPRPALVVEVLSQSTRERDLRIKRAAYRRWRIPEYWIVDAAQRSITVVRRGHEDQVLEDLVSWNPTPAAPALQIQLSDIFR